ncbi:MFS transporter [Roseateles sp. LYH14W]|uniref:MFS transporter n=1 Tax=Pelomonas parva TaxID=3299032 RepID=A0ABW7EX32_9BURK
MPSPIPTRPPAMSLRTMLAYGVGQTGAQVFRDTPAVLLPVFLTTLLGVPAWLSGFVVLGPKLWVILCDPLMGAWSDRLKSRVGRAPFLLIGALLTALGFMGLFSFTGFSSPVMAAVAIGVLFALASTAFSAFSVPYLAVAAELSDDPHERTRILTWRVVFSVVGVILSVGLAQPLVFHLGGGPEGWRGMALILGGLSLVTMLATPLGLHRQLRSAINSTAAAVATTGLAAGLRAARRNKPYLRLVCTHFIQSCSLACSYTMVAFIFIYAIGKIDLLLPFVLVMSAAALAAQPFWLGLSRRIGKRSAFLLACAGWVGVTLSWLVVRPGTDVLLTLPFFGPLASEHLWVLLRAVVIGITNSGFLLLMLSLLTDAIKRGDDEAGKDGPDDEGLLSGVFSAIEKLAFAVGPLLAGFALSLSGFASSTTGMAQQSPQVVSSIVLLYSVVPAAGMVISLLVFGLRRK